MPHNLGSASTISTSGFTLPALSFVPEMEPLARAANMILLVTVCYCGLCYLSPALPLPQYGSNIGNMIPMVTMPTDRHPLIVLFWGQGV